MLNSEYISVTDTAKFLRAALKKHFAGVKFSVRSDSYSGGASIRVRWTDGPTQDEVNMVAKKFAGATFDGMQDLKEYHSSEFEGRRVHWGADFVFTDREYTAEFLTRVLARGAVKDDRAVKAEVVADAGHAYIKMNGVDQCTERTIRTVQGTMRPNGCIVEVKSR